MQSRFKLSVFCDGGNSVVDILLMAFFKAWKDIKTRVRAKAVGLKNARLKTGNFPIDGNALSEEELMILGLVGPAATEGCRVPDTMPEEMVCNENIKYKSWLQKKFLCIYIGYRVPRKYFNYGE